MIIGNCLTMFVIYDKPKDYPEYFVAREFLIYSGKILPTENFMTDTTLDGLRKKMPHNLVCLPRSFDDDDCIIESYI
jgi:hypothetical protein